MKNSTTYKQFKDLDSYQIIKSGSNLNINYYSGSINPVSEGASININGDLKVGSITPVSDGASININGDLKIYNSLENGLDVIASGSYSHAEGRSTIAIGNYSHAEGEITFTSFGNSYNIDSTTIDPAIPVASSKIDILGENYTAQYYSGVNVNIYDDGWSLLQSDTIFSSSFSSNNTIVWFTTYPRDVYVGYIVVTTPNLHGNCAHSEGFITFAAGEYSHAEGGQTHANGAFSHAEGFSTVASGNQSHAEGISTIAQGDSSHAEGYGAQAIGAYSHAEGEATRAIGDGSHAEGLWTVASGSYQHVQGQYNISSSAQSAFIIGNGIADNVRRNLVFASGSQFQITGSLQVSGSITGSLFGTASWAQHALTSSYSLNPTISGSINNVNFIDFNESAGITVQSGQLAWNNADGTLDLGLKGGNVTLQIGQETLYEVRNATGAPISKGTSLYASGVTEGSGRIEASPFRANGSIREVRFLGLATENISNGFNGFVTHFGYIKGLDTRGSAETAISEAGGYWSVGDILYAHPTVPGKLTNIKPKHEISVAIVIDRHVNEGVLFVRPSSFGHLEDNHDVNINTGSLATGDLLIYDSDSDYWINSKQLSGSYGLTGSLQITGSISLFKDILSTGSTAYTLQQQDAGRILQFTSSAAVEITVPPNLQVGSRFEGKQLGTGQLSFVTGSGVTLRTAATENAKTAEQYSVFAIDWIGVEEYMLYGRLEQA